MYRTAFSCFIWIMSLASATPLTPIFCHSGGIFFHCEHITCIGKRFFQNDLFLGSIALNTTSMTSSPGVSENGQRWVFTLQYIASDYNRAVQNGRVIDSLEYGEMQRFARTLVAAYQAAEGTKKRIANDLRQLERLIAGQAELKQIRAICNALTAALIKEMNLVVFPRVGPDLANGERLFRENCVSCHGALGQGDGPAADTLNPKPRDFTDPEHLQAYAPHQLFQAISFGVEGTAMPAFAEAFTNEEQWDIAFYLMTLRRDFHPQALAMEPKLTLQQLATKNNKELAAILAQQNRSSCRKPSLDLDALVDYCRQNPPQPAMDEYLAITEKLLKQSLSAYARGDSTAANLSAYDAYWQGFEPIERKLQYPLYRKFEEIYGEYNSCIETRGRLKKAEVLMKMMFDILHHIRKGKGLRS
jgi:high-affinity iron transporter